MRLFTPGSMPLLKRKPCHSLPENDIDFLSSQCDSFVVAVVVGDADKQKNTKITFFSISF